MSAKGLEVHDVSVACHDIIDRNRQFATFEHRRDLTQPTGAFVKRLKRFRINLSRRL